MSTVTVRSWKAGDLRPGDVHRVRDARGQHWVPIEPGSELFYCEENGQGARPWWLILRDGPVVDAIADEGPADPFRLRCGVAFTHRTEVGKFALLTYIGPGHTGEPVVRTMRLDKSGEFPRKGRVHSGPRRRDRFEADYIVYRPCRSALECLAQATVTIAYDHLGDVDACDAHAADHLAWDALPWTKRGHEPEPDCWCTDTHRANGEKVDYCPRCGSGPRRGTEFDTLRLAYDLPRPIGWRPS